ncbi:DUF3325 domain-containing protein [Sphingopyxis sp. KK2]|uniref:DUF3325 domain-containing protein n=1 Tax=Sphingopyxis sp. KK2 TaxID=1855727 RepID=UPI00097E5F5B|nr:DUF3325 domain-containing protein [Sphingopyxis sp. KK2]
MTHILLLLFTTTGFALLCLSRTRHQSALVGRKLSARTTRHARWGGLLSLALAFYVAGHGIGWAAGAVEWLGAASLGALVTMTALSIRQGREASR